MAKKLICTKCGQPREIGRRLCRKCSNQVRNERNKQRNLLKFGKQRHMFEKKCQACSKDYLAHSKSQKLCSQCYKKYFTYTGDSPVSNCYLYDKRGKLQHRILVEQILGRKLKTHEVVHHLDENPKNNDVTNLIVLSRSKHSQLHMFLRYQRALLEQSCSEQDVNCWNTLRIPITTAWLETTSVKVIKIWEIGQSAAKHLNDQSHGEGSETRHVPSHEDDGIVQTTTARASES